MRNVVKGFEISHIAVPKPHQNRINKMYSRMHSPGTGIHKIKKPAGLAKSSKLPKMPKMPGKNPGIK